VGRNPHFPRRSFIRVMLSTMDQQCSFTSINTRVDRDRIIGPTRWRFESSHSLSGEGVAQWQSSWLEFLLTPVSLFYPRDALHNPDVTEQRSDVGRPKRVISTGGCLHGFESHCSLLIRDCMSRAAKGVEQDMFLRRFTALSTSMNVM
jgi:hypothetical protein